MYFLGISGGVMAGNKSSDNDIRGNTLIQRSSCVMRRVLEQNQLTKVRPLKRRSRVDLSFLER